MPKPREVEQPFIKELKRVGGIALKRSNPIEEEELKGTISEIISHAKVNGKNTFTDLKGSIIGHRGNLENQIVPLNHDSSYFHDMMISNIDRLHRMEAVLTEMTSHARRPRNQSFRKAQFWRKVEEKGNKLNIEPKILRELILHITINGVDTFKKIPTSVQNHLNNLEFHRMPTHAEGTDHLEEQADDLLVRYQAMLDAAKRIASKGIGKPTGKSST